MGGDKPRPYLWGKGSPVGGLIPTRKGLNVK